MTTVQEVLEVLNDIRRCSEAIVGEFKDVGDHYEYVGSMNAVEDLRDATRRARDLCYREATK